MLTRLAAAAEFRDDDTGQHTRRVGNLSVAIAERLGVSALEVGLIRLAAPLHDVGKIALPDAILCKPGKLTDAEFEQMKTHATVGGEMLAGSAFALLEVAEQVALTHHEKWDGSGYPNGLAGEDIPIAGRIVAVADVFDALTHVRPYKAAWSRDRRARRDRQPRGTALRPAGRRRLPRPVLAGGSLASLSSGELRHRDLPVARRRTPPGRGRPPRAPGARARDRAHPRRAAPSSRRRLHRRRARRPL